jgi:hypothetical protein
VAWQVDIRGDRAAAGICVVPAQLVISASRCSSTPADDLHFSGKGPLPEDFSQP